MVAFGGIWVAFENHLGRIMGFAILIVTGLSLLAISLGLDSGLDVYLALIPPAVIALLTLSVALPLVKESRSSLRIGDLHGLGGEIPLLAGVVFVALLTLAGFPILAGYPAYTQILGGLAFDGTLVALGGLVGSIGLVSAGIRLLWWFMAPAEGEERGGAEDWKEGPGRLTTGVRIFFLVGITLMVIIGML